MQNVLLNELLRIFDADEGAMCIDQNMVYDEVFDLMDKQENSVCKKNEGNVTYKNATQKPIFVFNYEKFIESLPAEKKKGIRHCDFIVSLDNCFFICNELSMGADTKSKWPKAWKQMQQAIQVLNKSEILVNKFACMPFKCCVFSTRQKNICSPLGVADAFSRPKALIKIVQEREWYPINQLGFKVFESDYIILNANEKLEFLHSA